jgi:hypothetical protein
VGENLAIISKGYLSLSTHERMSRGITLTEEQGEKLVKALGQRMLNKQKARAERDPYER